MSKFIPAFVTHSYIWRPIDVGLFIMHSNSFLKILLFKALILNLSNCRDPIPKDTGLGTLVCAIYKGGAWWKGKHYCDKAYYWNSNQLKWPYLWKHNDRG